MTVLALKLLIFTAACWASLWLATRPEPEHPMVRARRRQEAWDACTAEWRRRMVVWKKRDDTRRALALPRLPQPVPPWAASARRPVRPKGWRAARVTGPARPAWCTW